jgi:CHAT domain-containing protein
LTILVLARTFLMAGTRYVVASLWPVDDDDAVSIARWFYEAYLSGQSPARAMHLAKQRVLHQGADHSTVSAFQVFGDGA